MLLLAAASLFFLTGARREDPPEATRVVAPVRPEALATAPAQVAAYEEPQEAFLDQRAKMADAAILKTLEDVGLGLDRVQIVEVVRCQENGREELFQTLALRLDADAAGFAARLTRNLTEAGLAAELAAEADGSLLVRLDGRPTHRLRLVLPPAAPGADASPRPTPSATPPGEEHGRSGVLAIVIDDLGEDVFFAKELARLGIPVTFAVWPRAHAARETARIALSSGNHVLIHQPMEPKSYPEFTPGPGAVFANMDDATIRDIVAENVERLPEAEGMNNHMGSKVTEDARVMDAVLGVVKERGLYFLDSLTTYRSVAAREAARLDIPTIKRDVFLDNVEEVHPILLQLRKAEVMARSRGFAVAIGHPHKETLEALKLWVASRPAEVTPVALRDVAPLAAALAARAARQTRDAAKAAATGTAAQADAPATAAAPAPAAGPQTGPEVAPPPPPAPRAESALTPAGN